MRNWRSFLECDPLHVRVERLSPAQPHADLLIRHRLLGFGPDRVGGMLMLAEGEGFAVSDLSRRGVRVGFPHVCTFHLSPLGSGASLITVGVRGRWTAPCVPRPLIRL